MGSDVGTATAGSGVVDALRIGSDPKQAFSRQKAFAVCGWLFLAGLAANTVMAVLGDDAGTLNGERYSSSRRAGVAVAAVLVLALGTAGVGWLVVRQDRRPLTWLGTTLLGIAVARYPVIELLSRIDAVPTWSGDVILAAYVLFLVGLPTLLVGRMKRDRPLRGGWVVALVAVSLFVQVAWLAG